MENLNHFFNQFITLSFWARLFSWGKIRKTATIAMRELDALKITFKAQEKEILDLKTELNSRVQDNQHLRQTVGNLENDKQSFKNELAISGVKLEERNETIAELKSKIQALEGDKDKLQQKYETETNKLIQSRDSFEEDKRKLHEGQLAEQQAKFEKMKRTWSVHEIQVEQDIRAICDLHIIKYLDEVPFNGKPDNAIEICDETIIFDAKSPASDDLNNFPKYVKDQAEKAKKYSTKEGVRKDIYLVVPSNTVEVINQWSYELGEYNVYIITQDALEPVILSLKRLEDYHFMDQLSPEERDAIARIIGKFAHSAKRRIQIDQFFAEEFFSLLKRTEKELPAEFKEKVINYEKQEKLNPPVEKRAKMISTTDLEESHQQTNAEAGLRKIEIPKDSNDARKAI